MGKAKSTQDELVEALRDSDTADEFFDAIEQLAAEEVEAEFEPGDIPVTVTPSTSATSATSKLSISATSATSATSTSTSTSTTSKGGSKMSFKVGDIIVGKPEPDNSYYILNSRSISEVTDISGEGLMSAKLLFSDDPGVPKSYVNKVYDNLLMNSFRLATPEEKQNLETAKAKKSKAKVVQSVTLRTSLTITKLNDGVMKSTFNHMRSEVVEVDDDRKAALEEILTITSNLSKSKQKEYKISDLMKSEKVSKTFEDLFGDEYIKTKLGCMIDFFKEFQFEPNFRFINTLATKSGTDGYEEAVNYVKHYFALTNSPFADAIAEKIKSPEFKEMVYALGTKDCSTQVNKRLKCYVGSQGCGKTTKAMVETDGRVIVCNNSMLPQDLLEDFSFDDGKPGFHPSILVECMEQGKGIVLDEMNLLPFESLRFLQGILDGKKEFIYKGNTIHVKDGFFVISTMNLVVNSMVFGLPEPLVDRAMDIQFFSLNAAQLLGALA